jgi:elongation factor Tu
MEKLKFSLTIDCVFNILTKGILATGTVDIGEINEGDEIELVDCDSTIKAKCFGIEKKLKPVKNAKQGDYIGIILSGVSRYDVCKGMQIQIKE